MAKSNGAFLSLNSSGTLAGVLTARRGKGNSVMGFYSYPGAQNKTRVSAAQQDVRERFAAAKDAWKTLSDGEKSLYNARALPLRITGYNLFIREFEPDMLKTITVELTNAQILSLADTPVLIIPAPGPGKMLLPIFAAGVLDVSGGEYMHGDDVPQIVAYFEGSDFNSGATIFNQGQLGNLTVADVPGITVAGTGPNYGDVNSFENRGVVVVVNPLVNVEGGNAANSLKITMAYIVVAV